MLFEWSCVQQDTGLPCFNGDRGNRNGSIWTIPRSLLQEGVTYTFGITVRKGGWGLENTRVES